MTLKLIDLAFIRADDRGAFSFHDPVKKLRDLLFDGGDLDAQRGLCILCLGFGLIPTLTKQLGQEREHFPARNKLTQHILKRALNLRAGHGFAEAFAATMTADIVWIGVGPPLGPVGGHRVAAIATGNKTTQREIFMHIGTGWCDRFAAQPFLHLVEGFKADDAFMLRLAQRNVPHIAFEVSGIKRVGQNALNLLIGQEAVTA